MNPNDLRTGLDGSVDRHSFSGVISIYQGDTPLYETAAGYADRSNRIANTLGTRFGIASGTKFFTALAIGRLIAAGKLDFTTRLKDCLAYDFPRYAPEITIRHLLNHTSGIPDYYDEESITDFDNFSLDTPWYDLRGPRDYLPLFPDADMKFSPGERFSYSNGGYIVLGVVVEELSGMKYQEFVEREIFQPIGMNRSGYFAMNRLPEETALGYVKEPGGWRTNIYNLPIVGASDGGAFTTVQDLAILWNAFRSNEILPKELVDLYAAPRAKAKGEGEHLYSGYGLWIRDEPDGRHETFITGCDAGVSFKSSLYRDNDLRVTVISNSTDGAWPVLRDIADLLK